MVGNGIEKDIPAHLYRRRPTVSIAPTATSHGNLAEIGRLDRKANDHVLATQSCNHAKLAVREMRSLRDAEDDTLDPVKTSTV